MTHIYFKTSFKLYTLFPLGCAYTLYNTLAATFATKIANWRHIVRQEIDKATSKFDRSLSYVNLKRIQCYRRLLLGQEQCGFMLYFIQKSANNR